MKNLINRRGQMVIELVLMMTVLLGFVFLVSSSFRDNNFVAQLVSGPWQNLAGMMQNGVWATPEAGMSQHPNSYNRWSTPVGEKAK